jgi:hypothetical protein
MYWKLNHQQVRENMKRLSLRPVDLANQLGISRQMANYLVHHGGFKYAEQLAKIFDCDEEDLVYTTVRKP